MSFLSLHGTLGPSGWQGGRRSPRAIWAGRRSRDEQGEMGWQAVWKVDLEFAGPSSQPSCWRLKAVGRLPGESAWAWGPGS